MKKLFPIFVLLCIGFVVIGSRASRPAPTVSTPSHVEVKTVAAPAALQASNR